MTSEDMPRDWSVVMYSWSGDWMKFNNVAARAFGREGLSSISLAVHRDEHLPAELGDRLTRVEACEIALRLEQVGARAEAVRTGGVSGVRHRASEVWASCCTAAYCFSEIDGFITTLEPVNAREWLARFDPDESSWRVELWLNHAHVGLGHPIEDAIAEGEQTVSELTTALRQAYPERAFTVMHDPGSLVSFWQTTPESPKTDYMPEDDSELPEKALCDNCGTMQPYELAEQGDPLDEWGICKVCGEKVLVRASKRLFFINTKYESGSG